MNQQVVLVLSERAAKAVSLAVEKQSFVKGDGPILEAVFEEIRAQLAGGVGAAAIGFDRTEQPDQKATAKRVGARMAKAAKEAVQDGNA